MEKYDKINSVSDYVETLKKVFPTLKDNVEGTDQILSFWFRGESELTESPTPLVPNAYRNYGGPLNDENLKKKVYNNAKFLEENLKATFHRHAEPYLNKLQIENNSWNKYYLMQHYGLKTRLLDWTENSLIALFNAVYDTKENEDGVVWILNPHRLNNFSVNKACDTTNKPFDMVSIPNSIENKRSPLFSKDKKLNLDELHRRYLYLDFESNTKTNSSTKYFPLAIYPPLLDERMSMQSACFTIFGNEVNGLCEIESRNEFLDKVVIDVNSKINIRGELRWLGISQKNMLPGLEGICTSIRDFYDTSDSILKKI